MLNLLRGSGAGLFLGDLSLTVIIDVYYYCPVQIFNFDIFGWILKLYLDDIQKHYYEERWST